MFHPDRRGYGAGYGAGFLWAVIFLTGEALRGKSFARIGLAVEGILQVGLRMEAQTLDFHTGEVILLPKTHSTPHAIVCFQNVSVIVFPHRRSRGQAARHQERHKVFQGRKEWSIDAAGMS